MMRSLVPLVAASFLFQPLSAQAPAGAPGQIASQQSSARTSETGTARIRGRVTSASNGEALGKARVRLLDADNPQWSRAATTDAAGRYELTDLPAGRYRIVANRSGYLQGAYRRTRANQALPPPPLDVADGATIAQADISMTKLGVIVVRVTDEFGEPVAGTTVQPQQANWGRDGRRQFSASTTYRSNPTNDRGETRLYDLPPGEFILAATTPMFGAPNSAVLDTSEGFWQTFYPGTIDAAEAELVVLGAGEELSVQFAMAASHLSRISGRAVDSRGAPAAGAVIGTMVTSGRTTIRSTAGVVASDGSFTITGIPNGQHAFTFQLAAGDRVESAFVPISAAGDRDDLFVTLGVGVPVSGEVVFEGPRPPPPDERTPLRVGMMKANPQARVALAGGWAGGDDGHIDADGNFETKAALGERVFISIPRLAPGWMIKSVMLDGRNITDQTLDVTGNSRLTGIRMVVTDKPTSVTGRVTDTRGQSIGGYVAIILPAEEREPTVTARLLRTASPDGSGRFIVSGLSPGRYVATAVQFLEENRQFSPDFQRELRRTAREFTLGDGQTIALDLRLTEGL